MDAKARCKALCHSYYMVCGAAGGVLFPLVKSFEDTYDISHAQMGTLMGFGSALMGVSTMVVGHIYDRKGPRVVMSLGTLLWALSALAISGASTALSFAIALLVFRFFGGFGNVINAVTGQLYEEARTQGLNLLHAFMAVGKLLSPMLVAVCIWVSGGWNVVFMVSAILLAIWSLLLFLGLKDAPVAPHADSAESFNLSQAVRSLSNLPVLLGSVGFMFGVGTEMTILVWLPNFLEREAGFAKAQALLALTFVLLGYAVIRTFLGLRHKGAGSGVIACLTFLLLISLFLVTRAQNSTALYVFSFLLGVSFGPYWPSLAAKMFDCVPSGHGVITGLCVISSSAGSCLFVSLAGWLGDAYSLRHALMIAPLCGIIYAAIYGSLSRLMRKREPSRPE